MDPRDAGADAAERAESAGRRTQEIAERLTRLATERRSGTGDVGIAQQHAEEARQRAEESLRKAIAGHERAAHSHERAAEVHEQAARRGLGDVAEHERRAEQHRRDARADHDEAVLDRERAGWTDGDGSAPTAAAP
ncbi:hypothetical protein [Geodermatophilus sp. URMC 62]|uniref:hypothetical protein n=1 Tax=Geodermatophilus sp. URMC 62 TaxID=3423414 RepID=UPI00406CC856